MGREAEERKTRGRLVALVCACREVLLMDKGTTECPNACGGPPILAVYLGTKIVFEAGRIQARPDLQIERLDAAAEG